jgi:hypothetical protein
LAKLIKNLFLIQKKFKASKETDRKNIRTAILAEEAILRTDKNNWAKTTFSRHACSRSEIAIRFVEFGNANKLVFKVPHKPCTYPKYL